MNATTHPTAKISSGSKGDEFDLEATRLQTHVNVASERIIRFADDQAARKANAWTVKRFAKMFRKLAE